MRFVVLAIALSTVACSGELASSSQKVDASRATPETSTGRPDSSVRTRDATSIVGDAAMSDGPLPVCNWPPTILPRTPDGGIAVGSIARAVLFCGGTPFDGGETGSEWCVSESSATCTWPDGGAHLVGPPDEPCVMACSPTQYAVLTADPFDFGPGSPSLDADIIYPQEPSGCRGVRSAFTQAMSHTAYAEQPPSVRCCPCD